MGTLAIAGVAKATRSAESIHRSAILMHLALLDHSAGDINQCIRCPETLLPLKQNQDEIRKRITDVKAGLPLTAE